MEKKGYCTLCRSRCGTINVVEQDRLVAVRPDASHPTGRAMCLKGKSAPELVDSAERLLYPMRRTNPKGAADPGWVRIGWDEALDEIAARLVAARHGRGAESVAFAVTTPSGTPLSDSIDWIERFVRLYGSPNICYATEICNWHKDFAHAFTFGCGMPTADYRHADLILLWGHNPTNTWLAQAEAIGAGRANGARMVVVDPRRTSLAGQADQWLRVRPGSDAALAMGIANLLIEANAFDIDFVRRWTNGPLLVRKDTGRFLRGRDVGLSDDEADGYVVWDARLGAPVSARRLAGASAESAEAIALRGTFDVRLASGPAHEARDGALGEPVTCQPAFGLYAAACARYPVERAARLTWVPEGDIRHAASLIGAARSVAYHSWSGVGQHENATQNDRAIACLYALTGSFDRQGGNRIFRKPPFNPVSRLDQLDPAQARKALGLDVRPLGPPAQGWVTARDLYTAILERKPYAVDTLVAFGTNPLLSQPDVELGEAALRKLDFYVHCDLFENPSARFADILLPVNTPWEREGLRMGFEISAQADTLVQLRQRMVSARGESRSDNDIVFGLATRIGLGEAFFGGSLEAGWNHMLAPLGLDVGMLRDQPAGIHYPVEDVERKYTMAADPHRPFNTPTGRVELYSERLLEHGYPPLPHFEAPEGDDIGFDGSSDDRSGANASGIEGAGADANDGTDALRAQRPARFPLTLTSAKSGYYCHSQQRSLASLRRKAPAPRLDISTELAAARGIADGDEVTVSTPGGSARFVARVDAGLHPSVVVGEYGWWQACDAMGQPAFDARGEGNANFNGLVRTAGQDPVSGSSPLRSYVCDVRRDAGFALRQRHWNEFRPFRVVSLFKEAQDVTTVVMEAADGAPLPDFQPGQHATVRLCIEGRDVVRSYSMTGPAAVAGRRHYAISVRHATGRLPNGDVVHGVASAYINRELAVGDQIGLRPPGGTFVMPLETDRPLVMLAGGIGITPFVNLLETLAARPRKPGAPRMLLLYANQQGRTHAFKSRIAALQRELPTLTVVNYYDAPAEGDVQGRDYDVHGRVGAQDVPYELLSARPLVYMCGPPAMMTAFAAGLVARGVPAFDIHKEIFRSPVQPKIDGVASFAVRFQRSGVTRQWKPEAGPLLSFAESLGLQLPSGCRVGQCESCAVKVVEGAVHHLHGEPPDDDSVCLACQAVPATDLVLDA